MGFTNGKRGFNAPFFVFLLLVLVRLEMDLILCQNECISVFNKEYYIYKYLDTLNDDDIKLF